MLTLNTRVLDNDELERLYYQAGLTEIAAVYSCAADAQAENDEYREKIEKMCDAAEYKRCTKLIEHLQEHIREADVKLTDLYDHISDAAKLNRKAILAKIADVALDPDSEP